jgi:hypothetical protein
MIWPVVFLYEEYGQSDFVEALGETDLITLHLANLFPLHEQDKDDPEPTRNPNGPAWDVEGKYQVSDLDVFFQERAVQPFKTTKELRAYMTKDKGKCSGDAA